MSDEEAYWGNKFISVGATNPTRYTATQGFTSTRFETVVYPACQRGEPTGYAHDFDVANSWDGSVMSLLYCRQCGQVRKLEYVED